MVHINYHFVGVRIIWSTERLPIDFAVGENLPFLIFQSPIELMISADQIYSLVSLTKEKHDRIKVHVPTERMLVIVSPPYDADMEKFPVRMKDNDLLVTQLFEDPCKEPITALSVYFTPNVCKSYQCHLSL